ncbi:hypothetical protein G7Y89_g5616 [Cudoniella acicularis]|uniref:Uncharacterized protein n=1 Tax=Cudoniella acicularis TaxID=354080 RepID=A0A8H4RMZ0_9HELO|nr:hypothetical protein G7Y89_g5616 [Cudoniella acicularis]
MVSLSEVQASNARIASELPSGLVAVFIGATSGIGEYTLKKFAKHARNPRVYFIGRSQEAGNLISAECLAMNPGGKFEFIKADTSLIRNVDNVCRDIKSKEESINLLFLTIGTLVARSATSEGLHMATALIHHCRARFILNLLPRLQKASDLRRVVTVGAAGFEGPVDVNDFQAWKVPLLAMRGHGCSVVTLSLEELAKNAPDVSFIHNYPGSVQSNLARKGQGVTIAVIRNIYRVLSPFLSPMPNEECGERQLFQATSARYPAGTGGKPTSGVPVATGIELVRGTNGEISSGVYSLDKDGESTDPKVGELLANLRKEHVGEKAWKHTEEEFQRITGAAASETN